ncbi:spore germination lipoprotein GerD [Aneurinibacillus terranovensis]|uniref:spore germination lipoprotein GerD n=1 Tax=Aneurinibacillus terranovensis TaxID=278991 RepID=UPI0004218E3E|nr:spore germination lipoprotein GerD [Aneurinibacillus terranovensis]
MNVRKNVRYFYLILAFTMVTGCGAGGGNTNASSPDYREMKPMVVDILKTTEGKQAIKEAMQGSDESGGQQKGGMSTKSTGGSGGQGGSNQSQGGGDTGDTTMKIHQMMQDPKIAASFAKTMTEENRTLIKGLIKDPEYQRMLMDVMRDPQFEKVLLETMKSPSYRQQTMSVMKDSLQSPLFRVEMVNLIHKAQQEMVRPEGGQMDQGTQQQGGGQGDQGGKSKGGKGNKEGKGGKGGGDSSDGGGGGS